MKKNNIVFFIILLTVIACNESNAPKENIYSKIIGNWTFISMKDTTLGYAEIKFKSNKRAFIQPEKEPGFNNLTCMIKDDSLMLMPFFRNYYKITFINYFSIILHNSFDSILLYKIPFNTDSLDTNQIDPFYLRRCYFLLHLNFINMDDVVKYFQKLNTIDSIPKVEEIILLQNEPRPSNLQNSN